MPEVHGDSVFTPDYVANFWRDAREIGIELTLAGAKNGRNTKAATDAIRETMVRTFEAGQALVADSYLEDCEPQLSASRYVEAFKQGVILRAFLLLDVQEGRSPPRRPEDIENKLMRSFARCGGYRV